jgi:signal transduction histidine kinase/CheY-like chemotaxis protein
VTDADLRQRVLILAPTGRDAPLAAGLLERAGMQALICRNMQCFTGELERGAGAGVVTEEALAPLPRADLRAALERQPIWSDFQVVVCAGPAQTAARRDRLAQLAAELGNVYLVDRPIHPDVLVGTLRSALRARERQYQARELLMRLETGVRQREQFLATLSHELRNPLGAIRSAVQLATPWLPADSRLHRPLTIIDRQSRHLARLVDDLLDVARVTTGKVSLQRRPVNLRLLLESLVQQLLPTSQQHGLTLVSELTGPPCTVDGDPVRLEQIFCNVMMNAIKYTPSGGRVVLALRAADGQAIVRVSDSGVGMTPETLAHVFDLFAQADQSLDRAQGGMGIGLTLVRALTELHGGTASATSAGLGQGSELTVTLPTTSEAALPDSVAEETTPRTRSRHVLIVEDSPDNREMLQELLEQEGHRVEVAADGAQAVQVAARIRPEVALIDIGLPGIDGYEVARRIRSDLGSNIYLIALTGYGRPEDRARSAEAGFNSHLTKPPDLGELYATLATL